MSLRLLLVDDEPAILDLYKLTLELEDFQVETADSAAAAVALLKQRPYDLVITDMRMETPTSGLNVVRAASHLQPRPMIAVLSGFYLDEEDCRRSGADLVLVKGTPVRALAQALQELMQSRTAPPEPSASLSARP